MQLTRSLEDLRYEQLLGVGAFARYLGVTTQTYRRLLADPQRARMATRRKVLERLGIGSPSLVAELAPRPSAVLQAQARAALAEADVEGWIAYDPTTSEQTGERLDSTGRPI